MSSVLFLICLVAQDFSRSSRRRSLLVPSTRPKYPSWKLPQLGQDSLKRKLICLPKLFARNGIFLNRLRTFTLLKRVVLYYHDTVFCNFVREMCVFMFLGSMSQALLVLIVFQRFCYVNFHIFFVFPSTLLARRIVHTGEWPLVWKKHWIFPLFKHNSRFLVSNYRGLQITSQISKAMERFLGVHFLTHLVWLLAFALGRKVGIYCSDVSSVWQSRFWNITGKATKIKRSSVSCCSNLKLAVSS